MSALVSTESVTAMLMIGSLKTESRVLVVVRVVREVREGGMASETMSPRVGITSATEEVAAVTSSSWGSGMVVAAAKLRMGRGMAAPGGQQLTSEIQSTRVSAKRLHCYK